MLGPKVARTLVNEAISERLNALYLASSDPSVIASGGVGGVEDLRALGRLRSAGRALAGVIVGKALYEGRLDIPSALEVLA